MTDTEGFHRYAIVSAVRDEERYVRLTLDSVLRQNCLPARWIIVDDGSTDHTADIVRECSERHPFIRLLRHSTPGERHPGSRVIHAFNRGLPLLGDLEYDFIVKLDCDLSFAPDYFERLLSRFEASAALGIASGIYQEKSRGGSWQPVRMPLYHAFGACKVVRRRCFEQIGGFLTKAGWDTVDEIRAWSAGWETRHFPELETRHHKPEGSGIGRLRTSRMHGEIFYATGGDPLFFAFKVLQRSAAPPILGGALALTWGYVNAAMANKPRLVTPAEARSYRRVLRQRLLGKQRTGASTGERVSG